MSTWPILKRTEYQLMLNEYMKRLILLFVMIGGFLPLVWANGGCDQRLTREEFRARQQAYITEKAGLTKEEADKFFPLYFELQDRKKELNDEAWRLLRKGKDENISEDQYEEIMIGVYDAVCRPIGWSVATWKSSGRFFLIRKSIKCCEPRCVSTVTC